MSRRSTGNVAMTCRYFGISRPTYYTWLRRYETEGVDGLRDRSRRPRTSPTATRAEVIEKRIHLRQHYHFGPDKIRMYLQRYHDIEISKSGVWRILKRLDMGRLPASQRYKRHDRPLETLRETEAGPPGSDRRQIRRPPAQQHRCQQPGGQAGWSAREVLPVHCDRRLHTAADHADLPAQQPEDRDPVPRLRALAAAVRSGDDPNGQRGDLTRQ
nr:helix-turn-helix domain-containing protein [Nocardia amamiensis]